MSIPPWPTTKGVDRQRTVLFRKTYEILNRKREIRCWGSCSFIPVKSCNSQNFSSCMTVEFETKTSSTPRFSRPGVVNCVNEGPATFAQVSEISSASNDCPYPLSAMCSLSKSSSLRTPLSLLFTAMHLNSLPLSPRGAYHATDVISIQTWKGYFFFLKSRAIGIST